MLATYTVAERRNATEQRLYPAGKLEDLRVQHGPAHYTRPDGTISPGNAGYWHYHDHCLGSPHGTGGIDRGLFGALIVRPIQGDPLPDKPTFVVFMGPGMTIDFKQAPHTPMFVANQGSTSSSRSSITGTTSIPSIFTATGGSTTGPGCPRDWTTPLKLSTRGTIGPAESFGFQVVAGEGVGPGAWMYHCHVQNHSDMGMTGIFLVRRPDGTETAQEKAAVAKWRKEETEHHEKMIPALTQMGLRPDGRPAPARWR